MALEFTKLTQKIKAMGEATLTREDRHNITLTDLFEKLTKHATNWKYIDETLALVVERGRIDKQKYRGCRPLSQREPLNQGIDANSADFPATLIAIDGSQALSSRHAAYQYYLLNVGGLIYHHGGDRTPDHFSEPELFYLGDGVTETPDAFSSNFVSIQRDMAEVERLARVVFDNKYAQAPILAILDQRLQYWPIGINDAAQADRFVTRWIQAIENIQACGALLAGYIERPETSAVVTLLYTLDYGTEAFDIEKLNTRPDISDVMLYRRVLKAGQRSSVFEIVNQSTSYAPFRTMNQEICFFYYKPPGSGDITRIDVPKWAAQQPEVIAQMHSQLNAQCMLLGNYPYVLTRADEIAVVQRRDQEYLDHLIEMEMQRRGIVSQMTGKQFGKEITRASAQSHTL